MLEAVARGRTRNSEIVNHTGLDKAQVYQHLRMLERLGLVERRRPVTARPTSLKTSYAILDGFLNFYFRFVEPYGSRLRNHDEAQKHLCHTVLPQLDHFVSRPAWERICREHLREVEPDTREVGAWWGAVRTGPKHSEERELDAVAIDADGKVLATGSCKWSNEPLGYGEERLLAELETNVPGAEAVQRHYFFSRSGFSEQLQRLAEAEPDRVKLVGVDALYG